MEGEQRHLPKGLEIDDYIEQFAERLAAGWHGFTGTISANEQRRPEGVPDDYIMMPFDVRLSYNGRVWLTVLFELGRDEVGSTEAWDLRMADDIVEIFTALGLPQPEPIAVQAVDHQIAQKLHACTCINPNGGTNERAHDLVDLQILEQEEQPDLVLLAASRRADLVSDLLGGVTAGSFAISLAAIAPATPAMNPETVFASFQPPIFFAAWLIVARALRSG